MSKITQMDISSNFNMFTPYSRDDIYRKQAT